MTNETRSGDIFKANLYAVLEAMREHGIPEMTVHYAGSDGCADVDTVVWPEGTPQPMPCVTVTLTGTFYGEALASREGERVELALPTAAGGLALHATDYFGHGDFANADGGQGEFNLSTATGARLDHGENYMEVLRTSDALTLSHLASAIGEAA